MAGGTYSYTKLVQIIRHVVNSMYGKAIKVNSNGDVLKLGQDTHTTGQFLKWDGNKAVWDAAGGGDVTVTEVDGSPEGTAVTKIIFPNGTVTLSDSDETATIDISSLGGGSMSQFYLEDGDGTEITVDNNKEIKFVEGGGIDINWTDTSHGSDSDPYDLTFSINLSDLSTVTAATDDYVIISDTNDSNATKKALVSDLGGTTINNQAESRLVTIGSTTTELDGEANLTYNGTTFTVDDNMTVGADGAGHDVKFHSSTSGDYMLWDTSEEKLVIEGTNGTTALDITDGNFVIGDGSISGSGRLEIVEDVIFGNTLFVSGNVGIGTSAPEAYLDIKNTVDDGTTNRTMLRLHNYRSDDADVNDFGPISIDFDIENLGGGTKTGTARIAAVSSPIGTDHTTVLGEKTSALIFSTMNDNTLAEAVRINAVGNVGIGTTDPKTALAVIHDYNTTTFENQLSDGEGGGDILKYEPGGSTTLTTGGLYYLCTNGTWCQADADSVTTGAKQLLGIALGTSATSHGLLLRGFVKIPSTEVLNLPGSGASDGLPLYVSTTAAHLDFDQPSGTGDFVRVVGWCIDDDSSDILLWFNPDPTWVEIT